MKNDVFMRRIGDKPALKPFVKELNYNDGSLHKENSFDIIIGMDVIGIGDFCFTNKDGKSCFSFRIPSEEHIELKD